VSFNSFVEYVESLHESGHLKSMARAEACQLRNFEFGACFVGKEALANFETTSSSNRLF